MVHEVTLSEADGLRWYMAKRKIILNHIVSGLFQDLIKLKRKSHLSADLSLTLRATC